MGKVTEQELLQLILMESKRWLENQYQMKKGVVGSEAFYFNQAKARMELLDYIKATFQERDLNV